MKLLKSPRIHFPKWGYFAKCNRGTTFTLYSTDTFMIRLRMYQNMDWIRIKYLKNTKKDHHFFSISFTEAGLELISMHETRIKL